MDLSSPGKGPGIRTAPEKSLAASLAASLSLANGASDPAASGSTLDKSLDGIEAGGSDAPNIVRLRLECITEGQMKVTLSTESQSPINRTRNAACLRCKG